LTADSAAPARRPIRVAFVVQRYGEEISGGGEQYCRQVCERLAEHVEVEVLTTCALHYERWANHFQAGRAELNGVTVHRFPVTREREPEPFARFSERTIGRSDHGALDELEWVLLQGPVAPGLVDAIRARRDEFDLFVFWTYLYFPTCFGMPLVPEKAVFVPLAHDEAPFHLDIFRPLYYLPRWIVFNTPAERSLVESKFGRGIAPGEVIGAGVDHPGAGDAHRFRRKYGLADEFVLYVGRVTPSKSCHELLDLFATYKALRPGRLKLVLVGNLEMPIPARADVRALGFLSDQDRADALAACALTVTASRFESFSLTTIESWLADRTVVVNAAAAPLRDHVNASGGGLHFEDAATFCAALDRLLADAPLRARLAAAGRAYAERRYAWDAVSAAWRRGIDRALARATG
jgi:glycosyltransferase involved in cell wall biosynthesis